MENNVTINVGVKEVGGSVKSIKQELREAQASAVQMARTFGENSTEATKAAQKVAKLRDEIEDVGLKIKGLNPDKFQRIATLGQGVAQGFVAAQGAMALFGGQSQELEKTMVKLQGAIAMSQGLQGLKDMELMFLGLANTIKTQVVGAFATLRAALITTGIGAIVVAVGSLIYYFKQLGDAAVEAYEKQNKALQQSIDLEKQIADLNQQDFDREKALAVARAKAAGRSEAEIYEIEHEFRQKKIANLQKLRDATQTDTQERIKANKAVLSAQVEDEIASLAYDEKYNKDKAERIKKANEEKLALHKQYIKDELAEYTKLEGGFKKRQNKEVEQAIKLLDRKKELTDDEKKYSAENKAQILKNNEIISTTLIAQGEIAKNKAIQQEKEKRDAGFELAKAGMEAVQTLSDMVFADKLSKVKKGSIEEEKILRKQFELNKAMQIGTAVINGLQSILAITSVPDFTMGVASAMRIASQVVLTSATIAKIASTKFNAPAPTSSDLPAPPSQSNLSSVVNQQRNVSGTSTGATGQNQVVKVIVTETDITRSQGRVNDIRRRALIY